MGKERETERKAAAGGDKKFVTGLVTNCAAELEFFITTLLILCTTATLLLQIIPTSFTFSASDLRFCISKVATTTTTSLQFHPVPLNLSSSRPPPPPGPQPDSPTILTQIGFLKRLFRPHGAAAYNFVTMGAYRGEQKREMGTRNARSCGQRRRMRGDEWKKKRREEKRRKEGRRGRGDG